MTRPRNGAKKCQSHGWPNDLIERMSPEAMRYVVDEQIRYVEGWNVLPDGGLIDPGGSVIVEGEAAPVDDLAGIRSRLGVRYSTCGWKDMPDDNADMRYHPDADYHSAVIRIAPDGARTTVGADGGEPEDQTLRRDWSWVPVALDALVTERDADVRVLLDVIDAGPKGKPVDGGAHEAGIREGLRLAVLAAKGGASDYLGGYHNGGDLGIFRHGMGTIVNVLEALAERDPTDHQTAACVAMGRTEAARLAHHDAELLTQLRDAWTTLSTGIVALTGCPDDATPDAMVEAIRVALNGNAIVAAMTATHPTEADIRRRHSEDAARIARFDVARTKREEAARLMAEAESEEAAALDLDAWAQANRAVAVRPGVGVGS